MGQSNGVTFGLTAGVLDVSVPSELTVDDVDDIEEVFALLVHRLRRGIGDGGVNGVPIREDLDKTLMDFFLSATSAMSVHEIGLATKVSEMTIRKWLAMNKAVIVVSVRTGEKHRNAKVYQLSKRAVMPLNETKDGVA